MEKPVVWFEILGQHGDSLQGFYAELLGWTFAPAPGPSKRPRRRPRWPFPGRDARSAPAPPWWVTFYTRVPDLDAALARARRMGSRVLVPPTRHGETTIAVVSDPQGHPIGLCT